MLATTKIPQVNNIKGIRQSALSSMKWKSELSLARKMKNVFLSILGISNILNSDFEFVSDFNLQINRELES